MTSFEEIASIVSEELEIDENRRKIRLDDTIKDLGGDSLNLVQITIEIEDKYKIKFPKDLRQFQTVEDVVRYVEQNANPELIKQTENTR